MIKAFDLTRQYAKYLDPHFLVPVLRFMKTKGLYSASSVDTLLEKILKNTKYTANKAAEAFPDVPTSGLAAEAAIDGELKRLLADCTPGIVAIVERGGAPAGDGSDEIRGGGSSESTFRLAKFLYESGDYVTSAAILKEYLKCGGGDTLGALWGKFAADIMAGSWDDANQARMDLGVAMDRSSSPKHVTQQQRAWALHWSLFVCFHKSGGLDHLLEFFLQDSNRQVIQNVCPWLLRYVAAAFVLTRRRAMTYSLQTLFREVSYRDPIVEFMELLVVNFDFDAAQAKLKECEALLTSDYFLGSSIEVSDFLEAARLQMFQLYCRLHSTVSLEYVARLLSKDPAAAEEWVVDLIRAGHFRGRINSSEGLVIVDLPQSRVHQNVAEKTKLALSRMSFVWNRTSLPSNAPTSGYKHK